MTHYAVQVFIHKATLAHPSNYCHLPLSFSLGVILNQHTAAICRPAKGHHDNFREVWRFYMLDYLVSS